jgi:hypothetical protein
MKNIISLTLLAGIFTANVAASELSIGMANRMPFTLSFDNSFYATPSNTYNVTNVQPGTHHVRMMSAPAQPYGGCAMPMVLFDGWIQIPANARVTASALNANQLNILSVVPIAYFDPYDPYGSNGHDNGNHCGNGNGNNGYGNNGNGWGNGYGNPNGNGWSTPPASYGMTAVDYEALKNSIRTKSFESSKLAVAQQAASVNNLTSQQVLGLLELFSFESTKLEFAKYAYGRTVDRNNYYLVNNGFTFESSITELAAYINNWRA